MKTKKLILLFCLAAALTLLTINSPILEVQADDNLWNKQEGLGSGQIGTAFGETSDNPKDIRTITAQVVKVFLGFLGIIFVVLIVAAGFKYMTSQGNEEKIGEAMSQIKAGVIGLIIIVASYAITSYLTDCVLDITTKNSIWMCKPKYPQY